MFEILDLYAEYLSNEKKISDTDSTTAEITSTESITLNIDKKFMKLLKLSYKALTLAVDTNGRLSKNDSKILKELEAKVPKMKLMLTNSKKNPTDIEFDNTIAFALTQFNCGKVYLNMAELSEYNLTPEETYMLYKKANDCLASCLSLMKNNHLHRKTILLTLRVYNKIVYIWIKQKYLLESAYTILIEALGAYFDYTLGDNYSTPIDIATALGIDDKENGELDTRSQLDYLHIENLKRLGIVYCNNPENKHDYVFFMHPLLNCLIEDALEHKCYNEWAMATAEISRYFIQNKYFTEARHYLAAASYMVEKYVSEEYATMMENLTIEDHQHTNYVLHILSDEYQYVQAKIAKLWGQYGVQLLDASIKNLLQNEEPQCFKEADNLKRVSRDFTKSNEDSPNKFIFPYFEDKLKGSIFIKVPDKCLLNFRNIKLMFKKILEWFKIAIKYFTVEKNIETYGEIILCMSAAYKYFAYFEQHKDKQLEIYEARIELLDDAFKKVSHDTTINNIKKLMLFELGISYSAVLNIMNSQIKVCHTIPDPKIHLEMQNCMNKSMNSFISYLEVP